MIEEYKTESEEAMIITTEETKEDGIKYLNINVSNSEVERNPDRVRLCANVGIEEYVKPKTGALDKMRAEIEGMYRVILKDTPKDDWAVKWNQCLDEVLQIIDKYKTE